MKITLRDAHFCYLGDIPALRGISLAIPAGEQVALVGRNGSGKTTLARCLNGLLRPQQGEVWVGDWQTAGRTTAQLAQRVAYLFQNPDEQIFARRVRDEVAFGPRNLGYPPDRITELVAAALRQAGLSDLADHNPRDLGYSQRKLLALASVVAMDTPILALDEPTAGLDAGEVEQLGVILGELRRQNKTVILITHDLDFAAEHMDRAVLLDAGQVVLSGEARSVFADETLFAASGLIAPQVLRLGARLKLPQPVVTVSELLAALSARSSPPD